MLRQWMRLGRIRMRRRARIPAWLPALLVLAGAVMLFFLILSLQLRPVIRTIAVSKATNLISALSAAAVEDGLDSLNMGYDSFVRLEKGSDGSVSSLTGNVQAASRFRRQVIDGLINQLEHIDPDELGVPIGTLTGHLLLSGLGPDIRISLQAVGDVQASYESSFISAGLNQTVHRITLNLTIVVYLMIPGEIVPVQAQQAVPVAESVIVGQVPETYIQLEGSGGSG